ncbi:MAG: hypothetical protein ACRD8W_27180, partial [Nitrososphaeraceae archaeon]
IKPYQPVDPTGSNDRNSSSSGDGDGDYSNWKYSLTPKYAWIKEGENKITSKIVCKNSGGTPSVSSNIKHYSVNVTGFNSNKNTNYTTSLSSLSMKNSSYMLSNATVSIIPIPNDLLYPIFQANSLDNDEASDQDDDSDADNNSPAEGNNHEDEDKNDNSEHSGDGKGKAKGHGKNKG